MKIKRSVIIHYPYLRLALFIRHKKLDDLVYANYVRVAEKDRLKLEKCIECPTETKRNSFLI